MVNNILEIPRILVLGVKWLKYDATKSYLRNNPAWDKDD